MKTRFAPSPTGYLHLGHAHAAAQAFGAAQSRGGLCYLRIEDIDHGRCRPHYTQAIYEDLTWLGFKWPTPARVQSEHLEDYAGVIAALKARGLIYPCDKTRAQIKAEMAARNIGVYVRDINQALPEAGLNPAAWRLSMAACRAHLGAEFDALYYIEGGGVTPIQPQPQPKNEGVRCPANAGALGDVVVARRDIGVSYHIAVTHDDARQGMSHIIRGADLKDQTGVHVLLQKLMGWPAPIYRHHPLILRADGQKLAKRDGDPSIRAARDGGASPNDVWAQITALSR